jgi:hypothetical protein
MYLNTYRALGLAICLMLGTGHIAGWRTPRLDGPGGWYSSGSGTSRGSGGFSTWGGGK